MSDQQKSEDILSEINCRLKNIEQKQNRLHGKLEKIDKCIQGLLSKTEDIEKSTGNMDEHINFVNGIYDTVKTPFHSMMNMVSSYDVIEDNSDFLAIE
jgi:archaellum component FlaC